MQEISKNIDINVRLLLLLHMPPPTHGVTEINKQIVNIPWSKYHFDARLISLSYNSKIDTLESPSLAKAFVFVRVLIRLFGNFFFWRNQLVLVSPALKGVGLFRDAVMILILRMGGATVLSHIHGRGTLEGRNNHLYRLIYRHVFGKGYVICLSEQLVGDVLPYVQREQILVVPNGTPDPYRDECVASALENRRRKGRVRILFLSTMMVEKGPLVLLQALRMLLDKETMFEAVFAGQFFSNLSEEKFMSYVRALGLDGHVRCLQGVYGKDKYELYLNSDIFVFPTMREAFGLVAIEAMAAALPVVASNEGSLPEIVQHGETGFVFPKGDVEALGTYLKQLCESPDMRIAFGRNGRDRYRREYSDRTFNRKMVAALQKVARSFPMIGPN